MGTDQDFERIRQAFALARRESSLYRDWYPFLEALFLAQAAGKKAIRLDLPSLTAGLVQTKWQEGFPLLHRWDFPVDTTAAQNLLNAVRDQVPAGNEVLVNAHRVLASVLADHPGQHEDIWRSFMHHEMEPWEEWLDASACGVAPLLFWGRAGLRPSLEWGAEHLLERFPLAPGWLQGYCPVCGSLPALLFLHDQGERSAYCSWCGSAWNLHRLQCPYCDNRLHDSLGYLYAEQEPQYRVQYCRLCKMYFKLIDLRELAHDPYFPLEEWITVHLDFLAQREGLQQPPSPAPAVYGVGARDIPSTPVDAS